MEVEINKEFSFSSDDFLWRYLDLYKFLSFILDKKLFFTRLDKFDDPLEGLTYEIIENKAIYEKIEKNANFNVSDKQNDRIKKSGENRKKNNEKETNLIQKSLFANCWFINKKESFAMWNLYSNPDSVAIRYKPKDLLPIVKASAKSFSHKDFKRFLYGKVEYDDIWPFNFFKNNDLKIKNTPFKKDKSYMHENEFRFVVAVPNDASGNYQNFELPLGDIEKDDFKIFAHPKIDEWKFENLKRLLCKFNLSEDKLLKSELKIRK